MYAGGTRDGLTVGYQLHNSASYIMSATSVCDQFNNTIYTYTYICVYIYIHTYVYRQKPERNAK